MAIVLPIAVSWLENETFRAAWSPVDYWRDEARDAAEQNCDVDREWMNRSAEEVQIAIRKRSLGIATNGEVMDELTGYESFRDIHHSCIANLAARRHRANAMLKRLGDM